MKSTALSKFGPITILATILITSSFPLAEASNTGLSDEGREGTSFTKDLHRKLKVPDQRRPSEDIHFNIIDGEPLD